MSTDGRTFEEWMAAAEVPLDRLDANQREILQAAHHFLHECGTDYYSRRILGHFLLHSGAELKVAQIARLLEVSRQTLSRQRKLSSKELVQESHHRMAGKPYGKLLPRYAGPIVEFLVSHPQATRHDVIDFIERTWNVHVSTVALSKFYKKYGLDRASRAEARAKSEQSRAHAEPSRAEEDTTEPQASAKGTDDLAVLVADPPVPAGGVLPLPSNDFFLDTPPTAERSSFCLTPSTGSTSPRTASATSTAR